MNTERRTLIIINNAAARARRIWPHIKRALVQNEIPFDAHVTKRAGDATTRTRAALRAGYETIAVVGGDGTLSEAAAGFFEWRERENKNASENNVSEHSTPHIPFDLPSQINARAALAILPAGTGDDFARGLTGKREPIDVWIHALIAHCRRRQNNDDNEHTMRAVDVIAGITNDVARPFICLNVATLGIGAEVAGRVAAQTAVARRLPGEARFVAAALAALAAWRERRVRVSVDDCRVIECSSNLLAVANGIYAGGGMMFAPDARTDDGAMDVLVACGLTRSAILRELPRIRSGHHLANSHVRVMKAARVRIETFTEQDKLPVEADGNLRGHTPAEFHLLPAALRIVKI